MGRIFIDMDGTAAEWKTTSALEDLYEEGYFRALKAHDFLIKGINIVLRRGEEGFINSHYLRDSKYALKEKNEWVDEQIPGIPRCNRIFSPCGTDKSLHVPGGLKPNDILIDDYTPNLIAWEKAGGTAVKFMNGINGTKGTWNGLRIYKFDSPENMAKTILKIIKEKDDYVNIREEYDR